MIKILVKYHQLFKIEKIFMKFNHHQDILGRNEIRVGLINLAERVLFVAFFAVLIIFC